MLLNGEIILGWLLSILFWRFFLGNKSQFSHFFINPSEFYPSCVFRNDFPDPFRPFNDDDVAIHDFFPAEILKIFGRNAVSVNVIDMDNFEF